MRIFATLLVICTLSACQPAVETPQIDVPALTQSLIEADRAFAALSEQSDPKAAFAAFLAEDAIMLPRRAGMIEGREAAVASFGETAGFGLLWQPQFAEVSGSGDMGWTWGTYQVVVDGQQVANGKYVNIWVRQPDGTWKVRLDMGNQEPAPDTG